jgi:DsbC/DsbD-like thiol-disulfide interchange protein/cytochrome c biogenesis protein CcdA
MKLIGIWLALWAALLAGSAARAQQIHVHAALEAETLTPAAGSTVTLAITMRPDPGWHGYWLNPGDAGQGLNLKWALPRGASVGDLRFPVPDTLVISGLMNYVYERPHAVLVDLKLPTGLAPGTKVPIAADAQWLACTDRICVPQQGRLSIELMIGDGRIGAEAAKRFDAWRAALPVPLDRTARYAVTGKRIEIAIPYPATAALSEPYFFPVTTDLFDYVAPQPARRVGDWLVIESRLSKAHDGAVPLSIEGLLRIGKEQGLLIKAVAGAIPAGGEPVGGSAPGTKLPPLPLLLLGALLGGLILNIMPCVFPILGLKALALAKACSDEREARADALAYSAGVILSCVVLGGLMLALRAGGEEIGWAFQLQEPGFVLFLFLLMTAITANLLGLFEIGSFSFGDALTRKSGLVGSFWTGVLAALVATPCTGPFMAAALGAALLLPTLEALALFATLGVGIALPFLAIAYVPALRSRLPKPGPWLNTFRKAMAVPMGLTALALLWLLGRLQGPNMVVLAVLLALASLAFVIALHFWKKRGITIVALVFGLVLACGWMLMPRLAISPMQTSQTSVLPSQPFSEDRLATLRAEGGPVFVFFTADWCVTCKVNEAAVLERTETAKLFADKGVTVLRGDFTRRDPAIARFLVSHGHAGVPLYLFYPKGGNAKVLPQILTQAILKDAAGE